MSSRNICIIGPRSSGKTTYLASLACHQEHKIKHHKKSQFKIIPINENAEELRDKAQNLLQEGGNLNPPGSLLTKIETLGIYPFITLRLKENCIAFLLSKNLKLPPEITRERYLMISLTLNH